MGKIGGGSIVGNTDLSPLGYDLELQVRFAPSPRVSGGVGHTKDGRLFIRLMVPVEKEKGKNPVDVALRRNRDPMPSNISVALWGQLEKAFKHEFTHYQDEQRCHRRRP